MGQGLLMTCDLKTVKDAMIKITSLGATVLLLVALLKVSVLGCIQGLVRQEKLLFSLYSSLV